MPTTRRDPPGKPKTRGREKTLTPEDAAFVTAMSARIWQAVEAVTARDGISVRQLDERVGFANGQLGRIRDGERPWMTVITAAKIASVCDVSLDWLVFGDQAGAPDDTSVLEFLSQVEHAQGLRAWLGSREARGLSLGTVAHALRALNERPESTRPGGAPVEGWTTFFLALATQRRNKGNAASRTAPRQGSRS